MADVAIAYSTIHYLRASAAAVLMCLTARDNSKKWRAA